ncbi:cilia- and flagella-associated protein 43 [Arctopsyche grandis]|uniref:cilia- and flagella-associated protein 43 n=1 Tax=Arctopsyche grandis TaxID=121162 RepID=UPI00406D73FF
MTTTVRWTILNNVERLTFVNKDVIAMHSSMHIIFHNLTSHIESVYTAQDQTTGDGVQCFIGHKNMYAFAFAEKCEHSHIYMMTYPDFKTMVKIKDSKLKTFLTLELTEGEYVVALSDDPSRQIVVWSWRTEQKLICYDIDVESSRHTFRSSTNSLLFCYCWDSNFSVWEVIPTYKTCLLLNRSLYKETTHFVDVVWTNEGSLYAVNEDADLYSVAIDGHHLAIAKEWTSTMVDVHKPILAYYKGGFAIFGPSLQIQHLKKNKEWSVAWSHQLDCAISTMVSSSNGENLVFVTVHGDVFKLQTDNERVVCNIVAIWQRHITAIDLLYPNCEELLTLHSKSVLCLWKCTTGILKSRFQFEDDVFCLKSCPTESTVAMSCGSEEKHGVYLMQFDANAPKTASKCITKHRIDRIVWSNREKEFLASAMHVGEIFYLKISDEWNLNVVYFVDVNKMLNNICISEVNGQLFLMALLERDKAVFFYNLEEAKAIEIREKDVTFNELACYGTNHLLMTLQSSTRKINIYEVLMSENLPYLESANEIYSKYKINGLFVENNRARVAHWNNYIINLVQIHPVIDDMCEIVVCHRFDEEIKSFIIDSNNEIAVSLTKCGNMVLYSLIESKPTPRRSGKLEICYKKDQQIMCGHCNLNLLEMWISRKLREEEIQETEQWSAERDVIVQRYEVLKGKLSMLLNDNENVDPLYRLPLDVFRMHTKTNQKLFEDATAERENMKVAFENQIEAQDRITAWIKSMCWDTVETVGKELCPIFGKKAVENYALLPASSTEDIEVEMCNILKSLESDKSDSLVLSWKTLINTINLTSVSILSMTGNTVIENKGEVNDEAFNDLSVSSADQFIGSQDLVCSQMLMHTYMQMNWSVKNTQHTTRLLQLYFNEKFEEVMELKRKEISSVVAGSARLKVIVSELNALNKLKGSDQVITLSLEDPQWTQAEIPEKLTTVEPYEIDVSPYVSLDDAIKTTPEVVPSDPFYERALVAMMDATLEKLWHEEIKKPIPKPHCMSDKTPDEFTESDLIDIGEWEASVAERESERERYRMMLHQEYDTLSQSLNAEIHRFNKKVEELYVLKLKVESAIGQEELKIMLLREHNLRRMEAVEKYKELESEMLQLENEQERSYAEMNVVQNQMAESHAACEILSLRDRTLDKNFKTNLGEVSPVVLDLCYKLFKKRPKWHAKPSMTVGVLYEMASAALCKERPPFLHHDCLDYLKGIDQLDSVNNMPATVDEAVWTTLCKLRRIKIDNEIKMRAAAAEVVEVEAAYAACQKRTNALRSHHQKLKTDITNHRTYMEKQSRNSPIQLIVKSGLVEIDMTGHLKDFDEAILTKQEEIEAINKQIRKAAQKKLSAERATSKFKNRILEKEWEHATLKMKIKQLEDDLSHFERIKVTKEIQAYIHNKTNTANTVDIDKKVQMTKSYFDKQLLDHMQRVDELELKVGSIKAQMKSLDRSIERLKKDAGETQEKEAEVGLQKQQDVTKRINLFISRNKLANEIKRQDTTIVMLQTELELQRLRTFPTLSIFQSY